MPIESEARDAVENLDGFNWGRRALRVNEARASD